jgi:signal transduction histidine kinase/DNA-binding response OmpR family regulator
MFRRSCALLVTALGLLPASLPAQGLVLRPGYHATWWTTADGLPGNFISDITQSRDGHLWVVASFVLARFDGRRFEVVHLEGEGSASTRDFPTGIERGAGDTLWVATEGNRVLHLSRGTWGLGYDVAGELRELTVRPGFLPAAREEDQGRTYLWQGGRRLPVTNPGRFEAEDAPSLAIDPAGSLWAVDSAVPFATRHTGGPPRRLEVATRHLVGSAAGEGPLGVRRAGGRLEVIDAAGRTRAAMPDRPDRVPRLLTRDGLVVATTPGYVEIHSPGVREPERKPLGPGVQVLGVFEDQERGLWIGTSTRGLLQLRRQPFEVFQGTAGANEGHYVRAIGRGRGGSILMVAEQITRVRGARMERVDTRGLPAAARVFAAMEDSRGSLWVSVITPQDERLVVMRTPGGAVRRQATPTAVLELAEARDGSILWLTDRSWCRVHPVPDGFATPVCTDLGNWGARDLLLARDGALWIAGYRGVRVERQGRVREYTPEQGYLLARARALHEDADGMIWIGTNHGGLGRLAGDSLHMVGRGNGLAEDVVSTILEDDVGRLWMGGNEGIHSASKASIAAFLAGEVPRVSSIGFGTRDGLPNPEGSGWQGLRAADGRLWLPTFGGAVALPPGSADDLVISPGRVAFDRIVGGGRPLAVADTIRLPTGLRILEIRLAAVSLRAPAALDMSWRLDDRSADWQPVRGGNLVLPDLPRGTHRLQVRAAVLGAPSAASTADLVLVVPSRFAETGWFRLLLLSFIGGVILLTVRIRTRLLRRRARELAAEVREQTHWLEVERDRSAAALERVAETGAQLRDLLVTKSRVFAGLSHELRTPMSLILAPLQELEREAAGTFPPTARGHLGTLRSAVQRLERLTAQFLDLADTQSGTLRLACREVDLGEFLARSLDTMRPIAAREGVSLGLEVPRGRPVHAEVDSAHLDTVVVNLVGNGIRHASRPGGQVVVRLRPGGDEATVLIEVSDDGPGVAEEYQDRIFDPFFQASGAAGGMGLGLSISRDIVVLHGGRIEVASPPGAGATFRVILPAVPRAARAPGAPVQVSAPTPAPAPVGGGSGPEPAVDRILIVEDERELQAFLAEQLRRHYSVRTSGTGDEALAILREWTPHLVISDIMMPGVDGIGLCRILKADPATRSIPVILLTALGDRDHQVQGLAAGADEYVVKPFDLEQLLLRVANLLRLRRGIEDRFRTAMPAWASILYRAGTDRLDSPSEEFLARLYTMLQAELDNPDLDVDAMATRLIMSRSSLYRRVRALLDCSPLDVLAEVRLEQGALLLRSTAEPVNAIAYRVGFKSPEHFSRRFVAHFGLSPRTYRSQQAQR